MVRGGYYELWYVIVSKEMYQKDAVHRKTYHHLTVCGCDKMQALQERGQKQAGLAIQRSIWAGEGW
jgi:hypothetical protein